MIARALARQPKVLVLDQANAGLDLRSDRLLREALVAIKGKMTVVLGDRAAVAAAHRRPVIRLEAGEMSRNIAERLPLATEAKHA